VPYLILDLRNNFGGDICLGYQVIDALMEETNPYGHYDIIHTPLTTEFAETLAKPQYAGYYFSPEFWINPVTQESYTNISWYEPGVMHTRGGLTDGYSNLIHLKCNGTRAPVNYLFKQVLILTNGLCGSTCAVTSSHLGEADHVDTVVIGGLNQVPQQYFSFPGGEVFSLASLLSIAEMLQLNDSAKALPSPLPTIGSDITFALQEIYSWSPMDNPNVPLEFIFKESTYHLYKWNFTSAEELYTDVSQFFG